MTSILISSDSPDVGENLALTLAEDLGYNHLGLSFLNKVADRYKTKASKLIKALNTAPSPASLGNKSVEQHLAYIQAYVLEALLEDNIVCEGLAAHLYVRGVSHVLKLRLLSDAGAREESLMAKENISRKKAEKTIARQDSDRIRWSQRAFSRDESDASLYDMALSLGQMGQAKAEDVIKNMAEYRKFKPNTYSRKCLNDLALASKLRVLLLQKFYDFRVMADGSTVQVFIKCSKRQKAKTAGEIKVIANEIPEIKFVEVHAVNKLGPLNEDSNLKSDG
jgi:cytidylate kinase